MPITARCPSCAKAIKAPDHYAGKSGTCPACGGVVPIPPPPPTMAPPASAPEFDPLEVLGDAPRIVRRPTDGGVLISTRPELIACPFCGGDVVADALKCRHCGEFLREPPRGGNLAAARAAASGPYLCASCGARTAGVKYAPGSILIELFLWLFFLWPIAIFYTWYRHFRDTRRCPACKSRDLVRS